MLGANHGGGYLYSVIHLVSISSVLWAHEQARAGLPQVGEADGALPPRPQPALRRLQSHHQVPRRPAGAADPRARRWRRHVPRGLRLAAQSRACVQLRQRLRLHGQRRREELLRGGREVLHCELRRRAGPVPGRLPVPDRDTIRGSVSVWVRPAGVEPRAGAQEREGGGHVGDCRPRSRAGGGRRVRTALA